MNRRELLIVLAASAGLAGCARRAPEWARAAGYPTRVALPAPNRDGGVPLEQAISRRRSLRSFRADPLPASVVGQLLWAGQGVTDADGKRAAPSAGALYPLELYVATADEVMHYLPTPHHLEVRATADLRPNLRAAAHGQQAVGEAPAVIVVAAVPSRTSRRYGGMASSFVDREAGHAAQNILLQAAAYGLAAVPVGSVDGSLVARILSLPGDQRVIYLIPVGRPS